MTKQYLEVQLKAPGRAWFLEEGNHPFIIDQLVKHGYRVTDSSFGYALEMYNDDTHQDIYAENNEWIILHANGRVEILLPHEFEGQYVTS